METLKYKNQHTILLIMSLVLLLQGCVSSLPGMGWVEDNKQLVELDDAITVAGTVSTSFGNDTPLVLLAFSMDKEGELAQKVIAKRVFYGSSDFSFLLKPSKIMLLAFQDSNTDGVFQPDERVGWAGKPEVIDLRPGHNICALHITMRTVEESRRELPELYRPNLKRLPRAIPKFGVGIIASLNSSMFSEDNGKLGMWKPRQFMQQVKSGVYFLAPVNKNKVPVLFVHGLGGNPAKWRALANGLDQQHFQPWFFYYPSGLRLPLLSEILAKTLEQLQKSYQIEKMVIVAHSMGGLVARAAVNNLARCGHGGFIYSFVTLSTPWGGHDLAGVGVEYSPIIIPCWYDTAVDSPFLRHLFDVPLPRITKYHLLFSYRGKNGMFRGENNDGVITLKSQLIPQAQKEANTLHGFNVNHTDILDDILVLKQLRTLISADTSSKRKSKRKGLTLPSGERDLCSDDRGY